MNDNVKVYASQEWVEEKNKYDLSYRSIDIVAPNAEPYGPMIFGDDKFVAISSHTNKLIYSTDGVIWNEGFILSNNDNWDYIAYGNGAYVAIKKDSSIAAYSNDGINWQEIELPLSQNWYSITYGKDKFVALALGSTQTVYSNDGISWNTGTLPSNNMWGACTYGNDKFVALGNYSYAIHSSDGVYWSQISLSSSSCWESVVYGNDRFVAVATDQAAYSTTGTSWTKVDIEIEGSGSDSFRWMSIAYGNGVFVAVGYNYSNGPLLTKSIYSYDGITWYEANLPIGGHWEAVAFGNGRFVALSWRGNFDIIYSEDGINWFNQTDKSIYQNNKDVIDDILNVLNHTNSEYQPIITGTPGQFVVIGDDGNVTTKTVHNAEEVEF